MLFETVSFSDDVVAWYKTFQFHRIYQRTGGFCINALSAFFFRCAEGSPVHLRTCVAKASRGADVSVRIGKFWYVCWLRS